MQLHALQSNNPNLQDEAQGDTPNQREDLQSAYRHIDRCRQVLLEEAYALGSEFTQRRETQSGGQFSGLTLQARRRGRSVTVKWVVLYFKNGKQSGTENVPKPRGALSYDVSTLKRKAPEWLHGAAIETELKARKLREALAKLTEADEVLRSAATCLRLDGLLLPVSEFHTKTSANDDDHDHNSIPY